MSTPSGARAPRIRGARALFTARHGGVSTGDFSSWNLARHVGDDDESVTRNRALLAGILGTPVLYVDQVHSPDVHVVEDGSDLAEVLAAPPVAADALVTRREDLALAIMVADCVPVLLSDPGAGVVGAAHAGRRGLLLDVLGATVRAMTVLGARPSRIRAEVGPSVCGACYEVPAAMREESLRVLPEVASTTSWGTPALDLRAGARASLLAAGVHPGHVGADHPCTLEDPSFFSYRRAPRTGRFAGAIRRA